MRESEIGFNRIEDVRTRIAPFLFISAQPLEKEHIPGFSQLVSEKLGKDQEIIIARAIEGNFPRFSEVSGIIGGGGEFSTSGERPLLAWQIEYNNYLHQATQKGKLILGICYTEQSLCVGLGGQVTKNPTGREIGVANIMLTPDGMHHWAFRGLPQKLNVFTTHQDEARRLPEGIHLLAIGKEHLIQAFGTPNIIAVQFHPEVTGQNIIDLLKQREKDLTAEGLQVDILCGKVTESANRIEIQGTQIFNNFREHVIYNAE